MSTINAITEVAAIKSIAHAEAMRGVPFTEAEREAFKTGFIGGSVHGMDMAIQTIRAQVGA